MSDPKTQWNLVDKDGSGALIFAEFADWAII